MPTDKRKDSQRDEDKLAGFGLRVDPKLLDTDLKDQQAHGRLVLELYAGVTIEHTGDIYRLEFFVNGVSVVQHQLPNVEGPHRMDSGPKLLNPLLRPGLNDILVRGYVTGLRWDPPHHYFTSGSLEITLDGQVSPAHQYNPNGTSIFAGDWITEVRDAFQINYRP